MTFYIVMIALELIAIVYEPRLRNKFYIPYRVSLFTSQGIIFLVLSILPALGIPFVDIKRGDVLVEGEIAWAMFLIAFLFFIIAAMSFWSNKGE